MSSYGTVESRVRPESQATEEDDALLGHKSQHLPIAKRLYRHLNVNVARKKGDNLLLLCYVITGLLDSCATAVWGAFVSMQTGNTIYFGLGLANPDDSTRWIKSLTSISCFCLGSFSFARFHRSFGVRRRWVMVASFTIQLLMIIAAATISMVLGQPGDDINWRVLVPLGLLAFQSSGQAVVSRALAFNSLTSVVLTSTYCDLFSDAQLFAWPTQNVDRNYRAAAPTLLLVGAVAGGLWAKSDFGLGGALCTAAVLKACIVFAWLIWDPESESQDDD